MNRYSFEQVVVACFLTGLVFGGIVFFVTQHQMNLAHAEATQALAAQAQELEGNVKSLKQSLEAHETVMKDFKDARTKAVISYIDGLFAEFAADELILTKEWWAAQRESMLPEETEADE